MKIKIPTRMFQFNVESLFGKRKYARVIERFLGKRVTKYLS